MRSVGTLGDLLASRRQRRFVGRGIRGRAVPDLRWSRPNRRSRVLHIHGPPGIGKTRLLDVYAALAADAGATVVRLDGRELAPVAAGRAERLGGGARRARRATVPSPGRPTAADWWSCATPIERLAPLDDWVRTRPAAAPAGHRPHGRRRTGSTGFGLARRPGLAGAVAGGVAAQPEPGRQPPVPARLWRRPGPSRSAGRAGPWPPAGAVAAGRCVRSWRRGGGRSADSRSGGHPAPTVRRDRPQRSASPGPGGVRGRPGDHRGAVAGGARAGGRARAVLLAARAVVRGVGAGGCVPARSGPRRPGGRSSLA